MRPARLMNGRLTFALLIATGCAGRSVSHEGAGGSSSGAGAAGGTSTVVKPGDPVLDWSTVTCDPSLDKPSIPGPASADFMSSTCAKTFCHGTNFVAGLDLRTDDGFAKRTKDVVAKHGDIPCPDDVTMSCIPPTCPPAGSVALIDSSDPAASWILATANQDTRIGGTDGCGDNMPFPGGLTTDVQKQCLTAIVNAVAALP